MSSIDAVIAQARRPGNFTERKRFTLARTQAIQKLRQFALAEPAAYVLELIQSAVANGASWIEVLRDESSVTVAYIGGGIPESALARLFDYLFASKDDPGLGYLRELAIGVNALMVFEPERIIIESGDGTREGTSRMELLAGEDRFDVGRPDHALAGTYIRAEKMKRSRDIMRERGIIETRCLAAPVPILYNSEAIFGHSRQRVPGLPGVRKRISFDEGDLYGTIGVEPSGRSNEFALLTRGVLIETVSHPLIGGGDFAGVICFDGLRKSADHARIVRDERMAEMWLRVTPYARTLLGETDVHKVVQASAYDGTPITSVRELQGWLRAARCVVVVPPELALDSPRARTAEAIAEAVGGKLLRAFPEHFASLRILGGSGVELHAPDLAEAGPDLEFYRRSAASLPPRPWLVAPVGAPPVTLAQLQPDLVAAKLAGWIGETAELRMRVYTPASSERVETVEVILHSCGRELGRFALASSLPGHVLVVELPTVAPSQLGARTHAQVQEAGRSLAAVCLRHTGATLSEAADRLLAGLVDPMAILGPLERQRVMTALVRSARLRLRRDREGRPSLCFALVEPGPPGVDLLGLKVFTGWNGEMLSAREVAERLVAEGGWLRVHVGAAVDERDGLFEPLLRIDSGEDPLLRLVGAWVCHRQGEKRRQEPAAYDAEGRSYTTQQVEAALGKGRRIVVYHAREVPPDPKPGGKVPDELWLPAWSWLRLAPAGALLPGFDFHMDDAEAREHGDERSFIASAPVAGGELEGVVGVPADAPRLPGVLVVDDGLRHVYRFDVIGHDFGVVGLLRLRGAWSPARAEIHTEEVTRAATRVYETLLARVPAMDPGSPSFARATATLLAYAGRRVSVVVDAHGRMRVPEVDELADRILALPLFPGRRGLPLGAWHLIRRYTASAGELAAVHAELDLAATPQVLRTWIDLILAPQRVMREPARGEVVVQASGVLELDREGEVRGYTERDPAAPLDEVTVATTMEYWLHHLRPDLPAKRPWDLRGRVWIELEKAKGEDLGEVTGDAKHWRLALHRGHWLVRWAAKSGRRDREAIAWLLLACYARINEVFDDVTNTHEGQFQRAVADALVEGRLAVVVPRLGG